jgi:hypothetical protein
MEDVAFEAHKPYTLASVTQSAPADLRKGFDGLSGLGDAAAPARSALRRLTIVRMRT